MVLSLSFCIFGMNMFSGQPWSWNPADDFYKIYLAIAKETFFIASPKYNISFNMSSSPLTLSFAGSDFNLADTTLVIVQFTMILWSSSRSSFIAFTFYYCCHTIGKASRNAYKMFVSRKESNISQLTESFQALKKLADSVNSTWDSLCLVYIIDKIVYSAIDLDLTFRFINWVPKLVLGYHILCMLAAIFKSAEGDRKVYKS